MNEEVTGRIENWFFSQGIIWGTVWGDKKKRFPDGAQIHTATVTSDTSNLKKGDKVVTLNSVYLLGEPEK